MKEQFIRTALVFGEDAVNKLNNCRVAVFGVGGVGGYAVEALARSGIGALDLVDSDTVSESNINRQIIAMHSTVGKYKVDVAADRVRDINPECRVTAHRLFFLPETAHMFDFSKYDYVIDAVDTVAAKLEIISQAKKCGVPVICAMGAGNKTDPTAFKVADISKTNVCPLAKVMRTELRKRGIKGVKAVYSEETPVAQNAAAAAEVNALEGGLKRSVPGSTAFVPSVAGLIIAGEVIKDLLGYEKS